MGRICGVYCIRNVIDRKVYVGSSRNIIQRRGFHFCTLRKNQHHNCHLQRVFNKYGEENFEFSILEEFSEEFLLISREHYWMDYYNSTNGEFGYNLSPFTDRRVVSEETRRKMSISHLGMRPSIESRRKNSIAHKGMRHSEETRRKMLGKPRSEETKRKISESNKGRCVSIESRRKNSISHKGKPRSEETKRKISATQIRRHKEKDKSN